MNVTVVRAPIRVARLPIKIKRKPILSISKYQTARKCGGWLGFDRPKESPPDYYLKNKNMQRVLWCPYCGAWQIFRRFQEDMEIWKCQGYCGWSNTNDFWVKTVNHIWEEGLASSKDKKKPDKKGSK